MNSLLSSISLIANQFQDHFMRSFSNPIKNSPQAMRIIAVATLIFALLGLVIYGIYRWQVDQKDKDKKIIQQPDGQSDIIQKVQNQSPLIVHSKEEKKKEE